MRTFSRKKGNVLLKTKVTLQNKNYCKNGVEFLRTRIIRGNSNVIGLQVIIPAAGSGRFITLSSYN